MNFKVVPIPAEITEAAQRRWFRRNTRACQPFSAIADGYGPCRSCLDTFRQGKENRTSFTYNPFDGISQIAPAGTRFYSLRGVWGIPRNGLSGGHPSSADAA